VLDASPSVCLALTGTKRLTCFSYSSQGLLLVVGLTTFPSVFPLPLTMDVLLVRLR
jgi:hypothetical protein